MHTPNDAAHHAAHHAAAPAERFNAIRAAVRNRQVVYVLLSLLVVFGVTALFTMPRREDPKITIRQGLVLALYPGATAEQVEQQVARRVERRLFARAEVKKAKTYTTSRPGLFVANVELEDGVRRPAEFWAMLRHDLNEASALELPPGVIGPIVDADFGDVAAVLLTVRAPDGRYGPRELRTFLDRVEDAVRAVPATAKVRRWGEQEEELAVTVRPERLAQYGVTTAQVLGALRARNAVVSAGTVDAGSVALRVRPQGQFASEDEVRAVQLAVGPTGQPVRLGDVAAVTRRYVDPTYAARVGGSPAVLMSIEMQEGRNIVAFGRDVARALDRVRPLLPPDLEITRVADQPAQVRQRVLDFGREFTIAVLSVVLVTVLLLPLRVATIAAVAIPATVAVTVAALRALGIELHQISFAGLVVALGMVVDDAIVIADNYVELLDEGVPAADAAWRAASDLAAPVLGATLTIVASFLPLGLLLPGIVGEFIRTLPFTVAVALLSSYGVAMFLTPLLCLAFIRTGLRPHLAASEEGKGTPPRGALARLRALRPLDVMERAYARVMAAAMPRQRLTLGIAALSVVAGAALLGTRPQRFFPPAERPQFVVDVWMPEGTRFEATDAVVRRLAARLEHTPGVTQVGAFVGGSAPRFYYNVEPEFNVPNFGQLVVNTADMEGTPALQASLHAPLARLAPEATVLVKQLEQGPAVKAPVEIRLAGDDEATLRRLADSAARILAATPGSEYVRTDWRDDQPALALALRRDAAARLGLTEGDIAQQLAAGFDGVPATTLWEGGRRVDVRLRFDSASRRGPVDLADAYVTSPTTGARLPLREVADVRADWQPSRIVRRNGVRTVSVLAFARPGLLASRVLAAARPRVEALQLPPGYALTYGGEIENQGEVQGPMSVALSVSLLGIFLILFAQFRTLRHPLVVMVSIPLALFGSALGLVITGNPFGFTANLGLTALTGVVVRNAIILVDYALALRAAGVPLERAALDAGRRRMRPIFLTTMAAAVGVVPLIVSGSGLWSPLASVLAVGLVFSMMGTLVVVPILFVRAERAADRRAERRTAAVAARTETPVALPVAARRRESSLGGSLATNALVLGMLGALLTASVRPADAQTGPVASRTTIALTLDRALALAEAHSRATRIAAARVAERTALARAARADRLPRLEVSGQWLGNTGTQRIAIPQGALGMDAADRPVPYTDRVLAQDGRAAWFGLATVTQPLTPLVRIGAGVRAADAAAREAEATREATVRDVAFDAERLYLTALIADRREAAARLTLAAREARHVDATRAVRTGFAVEADRAASRAAVLDAREAVVAAENAAEDARAELAVLLGIDPDAPLTLAEPAPLPRLTVPAADLDDAPAPSARRANASPARAVSLGGPTLAPDDVDDPARADPAGLDSWLRAAHAGSPDVHAARAQLAEAAAGEAAARAAWIPEVALYGQLVRQNLTPIVGRQLWTGGVRVAWTAWDFGRRDHETEAAVARRRAADENLGRVDDEVSVAVRRAWRAAVRAEGLLDAATAAAEARAAAARITSARAGTGLAVVSARSEADAERATAEAERYAALLGVRVARAELRRVVGRSAP